MIIQVCEDRATRPWHPSSSWDHWRLWRLQVRMTWNPFDLNTTLLIQAGCQVKNWVSHKGRPWQKAVCLYSSRPSQASTKWIDRSALSSSSILYWTCNKKECNIFHITPVIASHTSPLLPTTSLLIFWNWFPHSYPRSESKPSAISPPGNLFWTLQVTC